MEIDTTRFWLNIYEVLGIRQTKDFVECLVNAIGNFVSVDKENMAGFDNFLNLSLTSC